MKAVWLVSILSLGAVARALAVPSIVEQVADGVTVVRDDAGNWGGMTHGMTHMNTADYTARKILDLSAVPTAVWDDAREMRLSLYFMVHDYSWHDLPEVNGLDEAYEIIVNGHPHRFSTDNGAPVYWDGQPPAMAWYDFPISREQLHRGPNEILIHKAPGPKSDDYLYLGIDNTVTGGNSAVAFDGTSWTQDRLTVPGGTGEYMVRLYLYQTDTGFTVRYTPGEAPALDDPIRLVRYVGAHGAQTTRAGTELQPGEALRMEWSAEYLDATAPLQASTTASGAVEMAWLNDEDTPTGAVTGEGALTLSTPGSLRPGGLIVRPVDNPVTISNVTVTGNRSYHPRSVPVNMCPQISPPACGTLPPARAPVCRVRNGSLTLDNGLLRARFETGHRLRLVSLTNAITRTQMVRQPDSVWLFWVMVGEEAYAGSRDFALTSITPTEAGFTAELALQEPALRAVLRATMEGEGLRLGLELFNAGADPVDFKLSFPHLAGLGVSEQPADDYYFFPWGGGIFSDSPAIIRRGYGDHEALYQLMDLYSPSRGGGVYLRLDDNEGWHKLLSLRKVVPGRAEANGDALTGMRNRVREEYHVPNPLPAVPGTGLSVEYLRRTRAPGGSFAPSDALLCAHQGDWHVAMEAYSEWAHRVWEWRPYPSRLKSVRNMMPAGWAQDTIVRDGKYRTDFIKPPEPGVPGPTQTNCIELMSWWEWSTLGPFMTPLEEIGEKYDAAHYERFLRPYIVKDSDTGQLLWNNAPGDYSGYNDRFGGLPALRDAIRTYQDMGALVTLYTDPFRLDENCPTGRAHGREWCIVDNTGKLSTSFDVFNPCYELPEARRWMADTIGRVVRETGADGIRLDEVGYQGVACYSTEHQHSYQEPGITQWEKSVAEMVGMVHAAMDQVRPDLVLTTELPGYDYLMRHLEGCITYDLTLQATPLRPLECNLQRFYFPECKPYELDTRRIDPHLRKVFWNGGESFERYYELPYYTILNENEEAYQGRDCTPLLSTPANVPGIYINRFSDGDKTLFHLYNASGYTFDDIAMAVSLAPDEHLFDLLGCMEVAHTDLPGAVSVRIYLPRNDVGCIVRLPRRLRQVERSGDALTVEVDRLPGQCQLAVADGEGRILLARPATAGHNTLDLGELDVPGRPACVKLLADGALVDVTELPAG